MSYRVIQIGSEMRISPCNIEAALAAMKEKGLAHDGDTLEKAFGRSRYIQEDGGLYLDDGYLGCSQDLMETIAPYVDDGGFLRFAGEDGDVWEWRFDKGECKSYYFDPSVRWSDGPEGIKTENEEARIKELRDALVITHAALGRNRGYTAARLIAAKALGISSAEAKELRVEVRQACRARIPLGGVDAQALEHALTMTEEERDEAKRKLMQELRRTANVAKRLAETEGGS